MVMIDARPRPGIEPGVLDDDRHVRVEGARIVGAALDRLRLGARMFARRRR